MKNMMKIILFLIHFTSIVLTSPCPCYEERLCEPLTVKYEKEVFGFSTEGPENFYLYDWTKLTTIAIFGDWSYPLLCEAHKHNVRVVIAADIPGAQLTNDTYKKEWIQDRLARAKVLYADGINIDFEEEIAQGSKEYYAFTQLVEDVTKVFHEEINGSQVSIDVPWAPGCTWGRCYDYFNIAKSVDFLVVMAYDELSQPVRPCRAGPNSYWQDLQEGIDRYLAAGINSSELVYAFPWYGYQFPCLKMLPSDVCVIDCVHKTDATQICYADITTSLFPLALTPVKYDQKSQSAYFDYVKDGAINQVWFDDSISLKVKYHYVMMYKYLRGVGMWHADCAPNNQFYSKLMWDALPRVKEIL